jgi:hypothetical protein
MGAETAGGLDPKDRLMLAVGQIASPGRLVYVQLLYTAGMM